MGGSGDKDRPREKCWRRQVGGVGTGSRAGPAVGAPGSAPTMTAPLLALQSERLTHSPLHAISSVWDLLPAQGPCTLGLRACTFSRPRVALHRSAATAPPPHTPALGHHGPTWSLWICPSSLQVLARTGGHWARLSQDPRLVRAPHAADSSSSRPWARAGVARGHSLRPRPESPGQWAGNSYP